MKINAQSLKQFMPYILIGGVVGLFGLMTKNKSTSTSSPSTDTTTNDNAGTLVDQLNTKTNQQISEVIGQTNSALKEQKDYYDGIFKDQKEYYDEVVKGINDKFISDEQTISSLTSSLHDMSNTNANNYNQLAQVVANTVQQQQEQKQEQKPAENKIGDTAYMGSQIGDKYYTKEQIDSHSFDDEITKSLVAGGSVFNNIGGTFIKQ